MNDKEIRQHLLDASIDLGRAAQQWPRYKDIAWATLQAGLSRIDLVHDYVKRPMGEKEDDDEEA
jgi:hypothetical protein